MMLATHDLRGVHRWVHEAPEDVLKSAPSTNSQADFPRCPSMRRWMNWNRHWGEQSPREQVTRSYLYHPLKTPMLERILIGLTFVTVFFFILETLAFGRCGRLRRHVVVAYCKDGVVVHSRGGLGGVFGRVFMWPTWRGTHPVLFAPSCR